MTDVVLGQSAWSQIELHARARYPEECCGFLLAKTGPSGANRHRVVLRAIPAENRSDSARTRRYLIEPEDLRRLEEELDGSDESVVGFYHSHPDHPARPSRFDRDHAWPWYTYLVVSVNGGNPAESGAFELDVNSGEFHPVVLEVLPGPARSVREARRE